MARAKKKRAPKRRYSDEARRARAERMKTRSDEERFWDKVAKAEGDDACWFWLGATNRDGYGVFHLGSRVDGTRRQVLAHRYAYELMNGPLGPDQVLLHSCDTPPCIRHTKAGTQSENVADMIAKGRHVPPPARRGPKGLNALLKTAQDSPRARRRAREVAPWLGL